MANFVLKIATEASVITTDPDQHQRLPKRAAFNHQILNGNRSESLRSMYFRTEQRWATVGETQHEALRALLYKDELIYLDDGDVPPLVETKTIYENATYTFSGITNPSSTHKAYTDSSASEPSAEGDFESAEYSTANYQAVDGDDTNAVETTNPTAGFYLYHKFNILSGIVSADVQRLRVRISCLSNDAAAVNLDGVAMYGWNGSSWQELARMSSYGANSASAYLNFSTFDSALAQSLVDSSDSYIRILIKTRNQRVTTNSLNLKMYYIEVEVNEGLSMAIALLNTPVLTSGDVTHVKNNTQATTLGRNDYSISGKTITVERPFGELNGSTEYFYRSDADFPESGITGDMTIQAWIYNANVTGSQCIVAKDQASRGYRFRISDDELRVAISSNGSTSTGKTTTGVNLTANVWTHVAMAYDASAGTADIYKNGAFVEQLTGLPTSIFDSTSDFEVGAVNGASYWNGRIAHVAIFDDIRTTAEILASYQTPEEDLSAEGNLIAAWHFDDNASASAIDNAQGDSGRDLTPYDGADTTFTNLRGVPGTVAAGEEVEVKYNRLFEGRIREIVERWQEGNPEGDRNRELDLRFESLSPEIVGS